MCLVVAVWDERRGVVASEGRMMRQSVPKTIAAEDVFKVHRLAPSLVVGIVGWAHVTDELLASIRDLTTYDEQVVTGHMLRLMQKYPAAALQAVLMGVQDGRVHAATWGDFDPSRSYSPVHPLNRPKVIALGNSDIAGEAIAMVRRGAQLNAVFGTLAQKYDTLNANVRVEGIEIYA
jgi:hypothetical protein